MKTTVSESDFRRAFEAFGRADNFTREGLNALYEYLTRYEEDAGVELELDVIALCCEYSETLIEDIERETGCKSLDELAENTGVIRVDDERVIYAAF